MKSHSTLKVSKLIVPKCSGNEMKPIDWKEVNLPNATWANEGNKYKWSFVREKKGSERERVVP